MKMSDKEELEWLREEHLSHKCFRHGVNRGFFLALIFNFLINRVVNRWDIIEGRITFLVLMFTLFGFGAGMLSAYYGRFKVTYMKEAE